MSTRLVNLVIGAARPEVLADFWAALLGRRVAVEEPGARVPGTDVGDVDLVLVPVAEPKEVKNRIHLDLASTTLEHQAELVSRALELGGRRVDLGQGAVPWVVLADPEGNEFCVLEPRERYADTGAVAAILVDAHDPENLAAFWASVTGWPVRARDGDVLVGLRAPSGRGPWLEFLRNDDVKRHKNRVYLGVAADPASAWGELVDPEGNEFCVLPPR
jgi:predicted enzyme related to lactoylglutathione lyase